MDSRRGGLDFGYYSPAEGHLGWLGITSENRRQTCKTNKICEFLSPAASASALAGGNGSGARRGGLRHDDSGKASPASLSLLGLFFALSLLSRRHRAAPRSLGEALRPLLLLPRSRKN